MDRRSLALKKINPSKMKGLELGPLYNPVVLKSDGDISYLDHMSTTELRRKYAGHDIPFDQIVPVDYVLNNNLKKTLGQRKFDYIIASHVIEHVPDMVRFLSDMASVLYDGGIVSLVIPHKKFTFDFHRNESRPADVIGAYLEGHKRVTASAMYDDVFQYRDAVDPTLARNQPEVYAQQKPAADAAIKAMARAQKLVNGEYVDCHCYVLTPASFFEIIRSLIGHNLFDFEVISFDDTPLGSLEFYVSLKKSTKSAAIKLRSLPKIATPRSYIELELENQRLKQTLDDIYRSKAWKLVAKVRSTKSHFRNKPSS